MPEFDTELRFPSEWGNTEFYSEGSEDRPLGQELGILLLRQDQFHSQMGSDSDMLKPKMQEKKWL